MKLKLLVNLSKKIIKLLMPARDINQIDEINKRIPKKYLKVSIHFPGLGKMKLFVEILKKLDMEVQNQLKHLKKLQR